jgi:hypothetical protein
MTHQQLVVLAGGLAVISALALLSAARRRAKKTAKAVRDTVHAVSLLGRVLLAAGVIAGGQYAVIRYAHNLTLLVCVLLVPALLAAATAVRALTVTTMSTGRKGHQR